MHAAANSQRWQQNTAIQRATVVVTRADKQAVALLGNKIYMHSSLRQLLQMLRDKCTTVFSSVALRDYSAVHAATAAAAATKISQW